MEITGAGSGGGSGNPLTVTDGITPVVNVTTLDFVSGAVVSSGGAGQANVAISGTGGGTVTNLSVVSANGFAGTVATSTTTPAITLSTSINSPVLAGNGTAISAATTTGSGSTVVLATSPTLVTPALGVASATSLGVAGIITTGVNGGTNGSITLSGSTSGSTVLQANVAAGGTLTLPVATDTLIGKATTDTLTNKTFDTAGTGNSFSINGLAATANTGTGAVVRATSPTLVTPALGTPSSGVATNLTGTASGLTAGTVTTNANLTGAITSSGNATSLGSFSSANLASALTDETGSGAAVFANTPTLTTAVLGSSTATTQTPSDNSTKVATTAYVDAAVLGQNFKEAAKYATTAALPTVVYNNGSSGVGATLTAAGFGAISLDGNTPSVGDRVLVKNQVSTFQNGIYTVTIVGTVAAVFVLTRSLDTNQTSEFRTGDSVFVTTGTANASTTWAYTGIDTPTIGTDAITYAQTAGQGTVTAGNGITVTGLSVAIDTSITVDKTTSQTLTNKTLTSPTFTAPVLGTPASGTGTNITGIPAANILAGSFGAGAYVISTSLQAATIELGAATDTTLSRVSAGVIAVEGVTVDTISATNTLTNKRITKRVSALSANSATPAINTDTTDVVHITAQSATITSFTTNLTGTPVDGDTLRVSITGTGAISLTWGTSFEASTVALPTTTVTTARLDVGFFWNTETSKWRCVSVS